MPAVFESAEFALVPLFAARAIIEVKRTGDVANLTEQLKERRKLLRNLDPVLGLLIEHPQPLFEPKDCTPTWLAEHGHGEPRITRLLDGNGETDTNGIMAFIYFLAQVAGHAG